MSKTHDLGSRMELSLIARIRQAAHMYKAAPAKVDALESYVSALECLAEYVSAKCLESHNNITPLPVRQVALPETARPRIASRVIPFPSRDNAPLTAA